MSKVHHLLHKLRYIFSLGGALFGGLCRKCVLIASRITSDQWPSFWETFDIGYTKSLGCDLCHFLYALRPTAVEADDSPKSAFYLVLIGDHDWGLNAMVVVRKAAENYVNERERRLRNAARYGYILNTAQYINHLKDISPTAPLGRILNPHCIDFSLLRSWIEDCDKNHTVEKCGKRSHLDLINSVRGFQVIDCRRNCIVTPTIDLHYAALSYVWGDSPSTFTHGGLITTRISDLAALPEKIPLVISDAMKVTLEMGIEYLWVDRYCIQTNNAEQIRRMDLIFSNAHFTIAAAAGNTPDHGLPGVSTMHRLSQPVVKLGKGVTLVSTMPHPRFSVLSSKWNSRGWAYQEAVLSRRLLIFTDEQVYFECPTMRRWESTEQSQLDNGPIFTNHSNEVHKHIMTFSQKTLSFDTDALNAMRGILSSCTWDAGTWDAGTWDAGANQSGKLVRWPPDMVDHLYGVPLFCHKAGRMAEFCLGLLWNSESLGGRREGFPSWSWTGWHNTITITRALESSFIRFSESMDYVKILVETSPGKKMSLFTYSYNLIQDFQNQCLPRAELSPTLYITAPLSKCTIEYIVYTPLHPLEEVFQHQLRTGWYIHLSDVSSVGRIRRYLISVCWDKDPRTFFENSKALEKFVWQDTTTYTLRVQSTTTDATKFPAGTRFQFLVIQLAGRFMVLQQHSGCMQRVGISIGYPLREIGAYRRQYIKSFNPLGFEPAEICLI